MPLPDTFQIFVAACLNSQQSREERLAVGTQFIYGQQHELTTAFTTARTAYLATIDEGTATAAAAAGLPDPRHVDYTAPRSITPELAIGIMAQFFGEHADVVNGSHGATDFISLFETCQTEFAPDDDGTTARREHAQRQAAAIERFNQQITAGLTTGKAKVILQNTIPGAGAHWVCFVVLPAYYVSPITGEGFNNQRPMAILVDSQGERKFPQALKGLHPGITFVDSCPLEQQANGKDCFYWSVLNSLGCISDPLYLFRQADCMPHGLERFFMQQVIDAMGEDADKSRKKVILEALRNSITPETTDIQAQCVLRNFIDVAMTRRSFGFSRESHAGRKCVELLTTPSYKTIRNIIIMPQQIGMSYGHLCMSYGHLCKSLSKNRNEDQAKRYFQSSRIAEVYTAYGLGDKTTQAIPLETLKAARDRPMRTYQPNH